MAATYKIVISDPPPPVVNVIPAPPAGAVSLPYSFTFAATAGLLPYQNWNETGALPPGLSPLTSGGVLSGKPTATGSFPITVTVQDSLGQDLRTAKFHDLGLPAWLHSHRQHAKCAVWLHSNLAR